MSRPRTRAASRASPTRRLCGTCFDLAHRRRCVTYMRLGPSPQFALRRLVATLRGPCGGLSRPPGPPPQAAGFGHAGVVCALLEQGTSLLWQEPPMSAIALSKCALITTRPGFSDWPRLFISLGIPDQGQSSVVYIRRNPPSPVQYQTQDPGHTQSGHRALKIDTAGLERPQGGPKHPT